MREKISREGGSHLLVEGFYCSQHLGESLAGITSWIKGEWLAEIER